MDYYSYTSVADILTTGKASQYNLNVSGGNKFVSYFTSFGYQYDGDIFDLREQEDFDPRTYQRKYTWRTNLDFNFTKTTKFNVGLSGNFKRWNGNNITASTIEGLASGGGDAYTRLYQTPMTGAAPELSDGRLGTEEGVITNPNYLRMERGGSVSRRSNTLYTDFSLEQNISDHLKVKAKLSYNYYQGYESSIDGNVLYYHPNEDNTGFIQSGDQT